MVYLYFFYSMLVNMLPTTVAPPEPPMTNTSQFTPATSTELAEASNTIPAPTTSSLDTPHTTAPPPPVSIDMAPISTIGPNTAGEIYSLVCNVTVTGTTEQPTVTWLDPMNNHITSGIATFGGLSTLTFNPLVASHDGMTYICRATLRSAMDTASWTVTVQGT